MEADRLHITVITANLKRKDVKVSTGIARTTSWFVSAYSAASVEFQFNLAYLWDSSFEWVYTYTA